ncbi:MAG: methyl-accepting chemotaxis protein [Desulfuromonadaceae bacterium]|nr:methyl-accepting chemotaxis protein [Desulfuromonadaceae bacterium]MDD2847065.1 methyl-accepting chemotaxis protein [Desulfuromonadaceae bacterium]MDD4128957.1 methyl-accepting chemotaxis protein [Desulfuromonadaceae bacterium]
MSFFRNINLFWKFGIFGALASTLLLVAITFSYLGAKGTNDRFDRFTDKYSALALTVSEMYTQGFQTEQALRNVILNPADEKALANYKKASDEFLELQKNAALIAVGIKDYGKQLDKLPPMWQENSSIKEEIIKLARDGKQAEAVEMLIKQETPKWREIKVVITDAKTALKKDMKTEHDGLNNYTDNSFTKTMTILVVALLVINLLLIIFWRIMQSSFNEMVIRLKDIASGDGDLSKRLEVKGKDELAQAAHWLNEFIEKISHTISTVVGTTSTLASATLELNSTADQMANNAEEVAAQASTVATASEEMAATSNDIASNCHLAAQSAQQAADTTQKGFDVVKHTVDGIRHRGERTKENAQAISSLGERSDQIGAIVATIEDIADQTNLLALNAAIEAARAGEQGRGFAVVADEVRALAERTTRATKEIGEMIKAIQNETRQAIVSMEDGVKGTEKGAAEATQLETALQEIMEQVNSVTMQISQIATAAEEQTATTNEITNNIHRISDIIEGTSKGAHDTAAASSSLSNMGESLQSLVSQFKLS